MQKIKNALNVNITDKRQTGWELAWKRDLDLSEQDIDFPILFWEFKDDT